MENILNEHWNILKQDPHLNTIHCDKPKVFFRRAPTLKNKIAPSQLKCIKEKNPLCLIPLKVMYCCNKELCKTCKFMGHGQKNSKHRVRIYDLDNFYNCSTDYVIYCLSCPCRLLYVGHTICPLRQRFGKHSRFVEEVCDQNSVAQHFLEYHNKSTTGLQVWVIEVTPKNLSEAACFLRLCECETFRIYTLDTHVLNGLNEELEISSIL